AWPLSSGLHSGVDTVSLTPMAPRGGQPHERRTPLTHIVSSVQHARSTGILRRPLSLTSCALRPRSVIESNGEPRNRHALSRFPGRLKEAAISSHHHVGHAERDQSGRKDEFISHSQRRRELVDEDDDAQDHRPPQTGHPEKDHGHHERGAASKAAEAVARAAYTGAP